MANAIKYGSVNIPGIPDDEPVFVLRAQDCLSLPLVAEYRRLCMGAGCAFPHLEAIDTVHIAIREWQQRETTRVKVPDSERVAHNTVPMFST